MWVVYFSRGMEPIFKIISSPSKAETAYHENRIVIEQEGWDTFPYNDRKVEWYGMKIKIHSGITWHNGAVWGGYNYGYTFWGQLIPEDGDDYDLEQLEQTYSQVELPSFT